MMSWTHGCGTRSTRHGGGGDVDQMRQDKWTCWHHGVLDWKLLPHQRRLHDAFVSSTWSPFVARCSRRIGKSYWACTEAISAAIRHPGVAIPYAAPFKEDVPEIINAHMEDILRDAPRSLLFRWRQSRNEWIGPHGSKIKVAGVNNQQFHHLRGRGTPLFIGDECGFWDVVHKVMAVMSPQTITFGGRGILVSSPPLSPAHEMMQYDAEAQGHGAHVVMTLFDAVHISPEMRDKYIREAGGIDSTNARREYLAEIVVEESDAVIPEFSKHEDRVVAEHKAPAHRHGYVAIDFGYSDLTFAVFGYWDFLEATIVVEHELVRRHANSETIVHDARELERELWGEQAPYLRVADAPLQVLADLNETHGYDVMLTAKDHKDAQINALRLACAGHGPWKLKIHPRCKALRAHLRHAIWNRNKTEFKRMGDDEHGHFDGVDALLYLVRNIQRELNPYPPLWQGETVYTHAIPKDRAEERGTRAALASIMQGPWAKRSR